ncbi:hypothetical protein TWF506_002962 [Arthrobotrys conoides]|uniref:Uncharacterized protein n=1 Tax=Arthrobotrys conoides TaxID=74498 RepID=A0AAN8N4T1_9PEZI
MHFLSSIIQILLATNIGVAYAAPSRISQSPRMSNVLNTRDIERADECGGTHQVAMESGEGAPDADQKEPTDKLRLRFMGPRWRDIDRECSYESSVNPGSVGIDVSDFSMFWHTRVRLEKEWKTQVQGDKFQLNIEPGRSECEQVWCIGGWGRLKACDFRTDLGPRRNYTWRGDDFIEGALDFAWTFWPQVDFLRGETDDLVVESDALVLNPRNMKTCCSDQKNPGVQQTTSDRVWGVLKSRSNDKLQLMIEGLKSDEGPCDSEKDLKGFVRTERPLSAVIH